MRIGDSVTTQDHGPGIVMDRQRNRYGIVWLQVETSDGIVWVPEAFCTRTPDAA